MQTGAFSGDAFRPLLPASARDASLECVPVEVPFYDDDGTFLENVEDLWSPLLVAMEERDAATFDKLLLLYAAVSNTVAVLPIGATADVMVNTGEMSDLDLLTPCLRLAGLAPGTLAWLKDRLDALGQPQPLRIVVECARDGATGEPLEAVMATARGLGLRFVFSVDESLEAAPCASLNLRPTETDVVRLFVGMLGSSTPADAGFVAKCVASPPQPAFNVTLADVVAVHAALHGPTPDTAVQLAAAAATHIPTIAYALAACVTTVPDATLAAVLDALFARETARGHAGDVWFSGPTPSRSTVAAQNVRSRDGKTVSAPTRAEVVAALLMEHAGASQAPALQQWATWFERLGAAVTASAFGGTVPAEDDLLDDPDKFAMLETLQGLQAARERLELCAKRQRVAAGGAEAPALTLEEQFKSASDAFGAVAAQHPDSVKLDFYALFKQGTQGDVTGSRPWAVNFQARAKYDAWEKRKGTSKDDAMKAYVALAQSLGVV